MVQLGKKGIRLEERKRSESPTTRSDTPVGRRVGRTPVQFNSHLASWRTAATHLSNGLCYKFGCISWIPWPGAVY